MQPLRKLGHTSARGTVIRYLPDDELFDAGSQLDLADLERQLIDLAWLCPKLDIRLQGRSLRRPEGLAGWVRELAPDAVRETSLTAFGTVDDVEVEVVLAWSPSGRKPRIRSFVNYSETPLAGSHAKGLLSAIKKAARHKKWPKEKVLAGLTAVVHVGMLHPRLKGRTWASASLEVDEARVAVHQVVTRAIAAAPWWWDRLHESMG